MSESTKVTEVSLAPVELARVPFHGDVIEAAYQDGYAWVPVRHLCATLGLNYSGQLQRLRRKSWAKLCVMHNLDAVGRSFPTNMLRADRIPHWLSNVDENRIKDRTIRKKIILFQEEAADVLARHFMPATRPPAHPPQTLDQSMMIELVTSSRESVRLLSGVADRATSALDRTTELARQVAQLVEKALARLDTTPAAVPILPVSPPPPPPTAPAPQAVSTLHKRPLARDKARKYTISDFVNLEEIVFHGEEWKGQALQLMGIYYGDVADRIGVAKDKRKTVAVNYDRVNEFTYEFLMEYLPEVTARMRQKRIRYSTPDMLEGHQEVLPADYEVPLGISNREEARKHFKETLERNGRYVDFPPG